jgi:adenylosuccinate lyase
MPLAVQVVHTSGVNWESVGAIGTLVVAIVGGFVTWLQRTMSKSRDEDRKTTLAQVKLLTDGSLAQVKLLTDALTDNMKSLSTHLDAQDVTVGQQGRDLARIEGRLLADKPREPDEGT